MVTLNTNFIPTLNKYGFRYDIRFRYIGGVYNPTTIIVTYKNLDICRVDMNYNLGEPYNYDVYWFPSIVNNANHLRKQYVMAQDFIDDIRIVINTNFKGDNNMNNKMYRVTDVKFRSSPSQMDEITFTVNVLGSSCAVREDCDRIREAIESIRKHEDSIDALRYCKEDFISPYRLIQMFNKTSIKDVIFNNPATIVLWADGTKTVVKAENEKFDPEKGLAMAIAKKALGNNYDYYDIFKKYVGRYEKKQKKGDK